jgi:sugar lactone lactonase YvrE
LICCDALLGADYIDSAMRSVLRFPYDLSTGALGTPTKAVDIPQAMGWPDGMCIDSEGMVWVAQWDGACVNRWNPQTVQTNRSCVDGFDCM